VSQGREEVEIRDEFALYPKMLGETERSISLQVVFLTSWVFKEANGGVKKT